MFDNVSPTFQIKYMYILDMKKKRTPYISYCILSMQQLITCINRIVQ